MIDERLIERRKKILEDLGELHQPKVKNKEWLCLLKEETRNSILVEGYFISEKELDGVLSKGLPMSRTAQEAFNLR